MSKIDAFGTNNKVFGVTINPELEQLLDLSEDKLRGMEPDDLGINAVLLAKYAYYIQSLSNNQSIALHFAESSLDKVVRDNYKQYKGQYMKQEEVEGAIISSNDAAAEYNRLAVLAKARLTKLSYLANRIQFVAQTLIELQQSKRKTLRTM